MAGILQKLKAELDAGITTEAQVVSLMANVRKLLERQRAKRQYEYLTFHCDWALHAMLDGPPAQRILKLFDAASIHLRAGVKLKALPLELRREVERISKMKPFEEELSRFLRDNGLPSLDTNRQDGWTHFLHLYARVVEVCPLVISATKGKSATIANVTLNVELANRSFEGEMLYKVVWTVLDKNGRTGSIFVINSFSLDPSATSGFGEVAQSTTSIGWSTAQ